MARGGAAGGPLGGPLGGGAGAPSGSGDRLSPGPGMLHALDALGALPGTPGAAGAPQPACLCRHCVPNQHQLTTTYTSQVQFSTIYTHTGQDCCFRAGKPRSLWHAFGLLNL